MSEEVTIPTYMQPDFVCTINNVTYRYKAGTTQEVPDEVAELIDNINAGEPVPVPPIPEGGWRADVPDGTYIAKVENGVAQYKSNDPYVIDLTSLTLTFGESINLTEAGIITEAAFLDMTASGRDIYVKAKDGDGAEWLWLMDAIRADGERISTTKGMSFNDGGITLVALVIRAVEGAVYAYAGIGNAANPYAG